MGDEQRQLQSNMNILGACELDLQLKIKILVTSIWIRQSIPHCPTSGSARPIAATWFMVWAPKV